MSSPRRGWRVCALALLGAAPLLMSASAEDYLELKDGTRLKGDADRYDETTQTLYFRTDAGEDMALTLEQLDTRSVYHVGRSRIPKDDGPAQLQLANFARDIELFAHSARHYRYAEEADPSLKAEVDRETAVLRTRAAEWAMAQAKEAIAKNDVREAEKWLTKMVQKLPDEPLTKEAREMLDRHYDEVHAARDDELEKKHAAALERDLKSAKTFYDRMVEKNKKGLLETSSSRAVRSWNGALSDGKRVVRELDKVEKKFDDSETRELIAGYRQIVDAQMIETQLNLASHYMTRSSFNAALRQVNGALAIDSENAQARAMRSRIETAANQGWRVW